MNTTIGECFESLNYDYNGEKQYDLNLINIAINLYDIGYNEETEMEPLIEKYRSIENVPKINEK